jgi:hypothetical protein
MYGLINKAIHDLVTSRFGESKWHEICQKAGVTDAAFVTMEKYPDETTYQLVGAASAVLGAPPEDILETFGEYWTVYSAEAGFGHLLEFAGSNLVEFLRNLDNMHTRIALTFPQLEPPSFRVGEVTESSVQLFYHSKRPGLAPLVIGMVKGLGKRFDTPVSARLTRPRADDRDYDEFQILYGDAAQTRE